MDTINAQVYVQGQLPEEAPNDIQGYQQLEWYQEALLGDTKEGGKKAKNMSKTSEIHQGLNS
jgi:hypothetical protein